VRAARIVKDFWAMPSAPREKGIMREAVICEAVRTPVGKRNGGLAHVHPVDLSADVLNAVIARSGLEPDVVDDAIWGCVAQIVTSRAILLASPSEPRAGQTTSLGQPSTGPVGPASRQSTSPRWA
jgi:Thiolase, N-terminal domain